MSELYEGESHPVTMLTDVGICVAVISVLVAKLGGRVELTQEDLDGVWRKILYESYNPQAGVMTFGLADPPKLAP